MSGLAVSHACRLSRRCRYSFSIAVTPSCDSVSAESAAFCVIDEMFDVAWLRIVLQAPIRSGGPIVQPQRHPVIAYDFDADPQRMARSRIRSNSTLARLCGTGS